MNKTVGAGIPLLLAGIIIVMAAQAVMSQEVDEYAVKAAFLYKLCQYVKWPDPMAKREQFEIGIVGKDPFGAVLDQIAKERKLNGKTIVVQRFASIDDIRPGHVLFIAAEAAAEGKESAEDRLRGALKKTQGQGTFLVGDTKNLAEKGAMINFFVKDQRVQFEVNVQALRNAGLQVAPNVLKLGVIVAEGKDANKE